MTGREIVRERVYYIKQLRVRLMNKTSLKFQDHEQARIIVNLLIVLIIKTGLFLTILLGKE